MVGNSVEVLGIGTVNLPAKISPTQTGPSSHGILRLKKVLHAPGVLCNIIGQPIVDDYQVTLSPGISSSGSITNLTDGRSVAYFKPMRSARFWEVRLSGPPVGPKVGPSPFSSSGLYMIHAFWPDSERQRFAALPASRQSQATASEHLTLAEKAWVKTHYGTEFRFLRDYGLSIFKDEDREEGRLILRAIMSDDGYESAT
ncbi:hypothetical protein PENSUB_10635 [Penicillium subrubescens]|uniref:Uncharacterized protein n=2 Tax=Penicillium subrubescens TaxID=1316194 RepID=A0A1Q5T8C3_9EURO|nr:hypothetical protein PENSUB_10635 [Penicillium subrubescens]